MRRFAALLLVFALLTVLSPGAAAESDAPESHALSAVLMEASTGRVLYEKDADTHRLIASTTKIMTAIIAVENCNMDDVVTIERQHLVEGSSMDLREGERLTVYQLLCGLLLESGNDAAAALACHAAGGIESFAALMNAKAEQLGMTESHFMNPHGLDHREHYSTARDMAKLAVAAMDCGLIAEIVSTKELTVAGHQLKNHNKLLWNYEGALGLKTGYTDAAGRTLVSCAERDGLRLVCVTLNDGDDWNDHMALFDWGFENFEHRTLVEAGADYGTVQVVSGVRDSVPVYAAESLTVFARKGEEAELTVYLPPFVYAEVYRGARAGRIEAVTADGTAYTARLAYGETLIQDSSVKLTAREKLKRAWYIANGNGLNRYGYYLWM